MPGVITAIETLDEAELRQLAAASRKARPTVEQRRKFARLVRESEATARADGIKRDVGLPALMLVHDRMQRAHGSPQRKGENDMLQAWHNRKESR